MKKGILVTIIAIVVLSLAAVIGTTVGLSHTVGELAVEISKSNAADAILASADKSDTVIVNMPVIYYSQAMDGCVDLYDVTLEKDVEARQFGWSECGYYNKTMEQGLVEGVLNSEHLPVAIGGERQTNRGMAGESFRRWFSTVAEASQSYPGTLGLRYDPSAGSFRFDSDNYYPLKQVENGQLFTMSLGVPVQVMADGREAFSVTADDDTWVYVGDRLVLDMGGVHEATVGSFEITKDGEVYTSVGEDELGFSGVILDKDARTTVRIFHANRDGAESVFHLEFSNMMLGMEEATLARNDGETIAYGQGDSGYAAPLGRSLTYSADHSQMILTSAVVQSVMVGVLGVVAVAAISVAFRYWRRGHNPEE